MSGPSLITWVQVWCLSCEISGTPDIAHHWTYHIFMVLSSLICFYLLYHISSSISWHMLRCLISTNWWMNEWFTDICFQVRPPPWVFIQAEHVKKLNSLSFPRKMVFIPAPQFFFSVKHIKICPTAKNSKVRIVQDSALSLTPHPVCHTAHQP